MGTFLGAVVAVPMNECKARFLYKIYSRNLEYGVYDGKGGFIGIRIKFGNRYLDTEYHYDTGAPYGTVRPDKEIEEIPEDIEVVEFFQYQPTLIKNEKLFDYLKEKENV
jgi:hypothetical protein